ncbi:hypothetical protein J6590_015578 [Homalodisca vitripennis]|nr:hypothetical protein J6590_015578 [Homalodisca vitripennis]
MKNWNDWKTRNDNIVSVVCLEITIVPVVKSNGPIRICTYYSYRKRLKLKNEDSQTVNSDKEVYETKRKGVTNYSSEKKSGAVAESSQGTN